MPIGSLEVVVCQLKIRLIPTKLWCRDRNKSLYRGVTFKQDYNAENRISAIHKMNGDCSTGSVTESWLYGYDGDGVRVTTAHYTGVTQDLLTLYYMGGAYEVTGSAVKKYYSIAGQTIAMNDGSGLKYMLTDHLGSTSAVVDANGSLLSQQRYLPFGEVRSIPNSPIVQTDFGYTGQRNLSGTGLMDYRARFYSVSLGRFVQPDSIIPNPINPQSWNRYSYVINRPTVFIDPSGHTYLCDEECENRQEPTNLSTRIRGGSADKPGCGVNGKGAYGFHCTVEDLDGATMKQRLEWFQWLTGTMDENIKPGTSDWFNNIETVVGSFVWSGQDDNDWLLTVDANILVAVQDGYAAYLGYGGAIAGGSGADKWREFFVALGGQETDEDQLIALWGAAEQAGTNEGLVRAAALGYGGGEWWMFNWITTDYGRDDILFTTIGNWYRGSSTWACPDTCVGVWGGFFDPRTTWGSMSPVGYAAYPVYFLDFLGYAVTGH
jgi:RHS repeat-associated protein